MCRYQSNKDHRTDGGCGACGGFRVTPEQAAEVWNMRADDGKRTDNNEWVEGDVFHYESGEIAIHSGFSRYGYESTELVGRNNVDPSTVGQYTGLTDKNGRKIFEGDIINYKGALAKVIYSTENAGFYALFSSWDTDLRALSAGKYVSVIGNIYDNPELLKGGNENG